MASIISSLISGFKTLSMLYDYFNKRLDREIQEVGADKVKKYEKLIEGKLSKP